MNAKIFSILLFSTLLFISACEDQGDPVSPPPANPPVINSIVPDSGAVGDTVTIKGTKFGTLQGSSSVTFGTVSASTIVSWNDSTIRVTIPANSATGNVTVKVNGTSSAGKQFKVLGTVTLVSFASAIQPLITQYACANCHPSNGGFSVATHAQIISRVITGNGEGSLLVKKLRGTAGGSRMPQNGPPYMSNAEIQKFVDWINQGALNN